MRSFGMSRYFGISLAASIIALQAPVHGDWLEDSTGGISAGDPQDVVISLKATVSGRPHR